MEETCHSKHAARERTTSRDFSMCALGRVVAMLLWRAVLPASGILLHSTTCAFGQETTLVHTCCQTAKSELQWDNVEGRPLWVDGCAPTLRPRYGMHLVTLLPGASTSVRVPADGHVRIVSPSCPISRDDVAIWVSNGSGVARLHQAAVSTKGHSLVVASDLPHPAVVHIVRGPEQNCGIEIALFVSRREHVHEPLPFGTTICGWNRVDVRRQRDGRLDCYSQLPPNHWQPLKARPGQQLVLDTRFFYPHTESRRFQTYQLLLRYDGRIGQVVEFETTSETRTVYEINGCDAILGQLERAFVCIPKTVKQVEISSTAPVLLRAQLCGGYRHAENLGQVCGADCLFAGLPSGQTSIWHLNDAEIFQQVQNPAACLAPALLYRIARDNAHQSGGLTGAILAKSQAARFDQNPRWTNTARDIRTRHTGYRNLLPHSKGPHGLQRYQWFFARKPIDDRLPRDEFALGLQFTEDMLNKTLSAGIFVLAPTWDQSPLAYHLPHESSPSCLRVAVDRRFLSRATTLQLQFDDRAPVSLRVFRDAELSGDQYAPSLGEMGLAGLHAMHASVDSGTLGGPFSQRNEPAELMEAGINEMLVPASARTVRIWCTDANAEVPVAVQYRKSNPFQLSETGYLEMAGRAGVGRPDFWPRLIQERADVHQPLFHHELKNHWLPLLRLLRNHERQLFAKVPPPRDSATVQTDEDQIRRLMEEGRWASAFAASTELMPRVRELARLQLLALEKAGETNMLEQMLLGGALHSPDPIVRRLSYRQLMDRYHAADQLDQKEALAACFALRHHDAEFLLDLAECLRDNERYDFAMLVALSIPKHPRAAEVAVQCAYHRHWWQVFDTALQELPDHQLREFWRAHRCLQHGQYDQAIGHFQAGGDVGQAFAKQLESGRDVLRRLRSPEAHERAQAILDWEKWQAEHPGQSHWVETQAVVAESRGGALVRSINRDLTSRYHLAQPTAPIRVVLYGPVKLKITARPLHASSTSPPVDDWLNVFTTGFHHVVPVNSNRPSRGLEIIGDSRSSGVAVEQELEFGAGRHEMYVACSHLSCLVQFHTARPRTPIPVLPPLNPYTFTAALAGRLRVHGDTVLGANSHRVRVQKQLHGAAEAAFVYPPQHGEWQPDDTLQSLEAHQAARMSLRLGLNAVDLKEAYGNLAHRSDEVGPHERTLALAFAGELDSAQQLLLDGPLALPHELALAYLMDRYGAEVASDFAQHPPDGQSDSDTVYRQVKYLARAAKDNPARQAQLSVQGYALAETHSHLPELRGLRERLERNISWQLLRNVDSSAGIHLQRVVGWEPESPGLRLQKQFMSNLQPEDLVLAGQETLSLQMRNLEPTELTIELELLETMYRPLGSCVVKMSTPGRMPELVRIQPGQKPVVRRMSLSKGQHSLEWMMEESFAGHFVRIRVVEHRPDTGEIKVLSKDIQRHYHVATTDEPIELSIAGPTLLRVDQLNRESQYMAAPNPLNRITIRPPDDSGQFRIFQASYDPEKQPRFPLDASAEPVPVDTSLLGEVELPAESPIDADAVQLVMYEDSSDLSYLQLLAADGPPVPVDHLDRRVLGGQEDGTWTAGGGWFHRRPVDELPFAGQADEFVELSATHRYFDEDQDYYRKTKLISRVRDEAAHSYGFEHDHWFQSSDHHGWNMHGFAAGFLQRPETAQPNVDPNTEWSLYFRGTVSRRFDIRDRFYHVPTFGAFARVLSAEENQYISGQIDQNVFTTYKHDHPIGLTFSDRFVFQRCADYYWWMRPAFSTNEGINPIDIDNVRLSSGWTGIKGEFDWEVGYRYAHYLEDDDRSRAADQQMLLADFNWNHWSFAGRHVEVSGRLRHDVTSERASAGLWFTYYFDRGRRYRDFHVSDLPFPNIRRQRADWGSSTGLIE